MKTGFSDLDKIVDLDSNNLIMIAGSHFTGKTTFVLNIMNNVSNDVLLFSLEMSNKLVNSILISQEAFIDIEKINNNELDDKEFQKYKIYQEKLKKQNLYVNDTPAISIKQIEEQCIKMKEEKDIKLVIIDYLQLVDSKNNESNTLKIQDISFRLKQLSEYINIPIIVTSALSNDVDNRLDHKPKITDFKSSRPLSEVADTILLLYKDDYHDPDSKKKNLVKINIAKNKNGKLKIIELKYNSDFRKFEDI